MKLIHLVNLLGNCPLAQAIPRVKKIWPDKKLKSVLSLTTPLNQPVKKLKDFETQWEKNLATRLDLSEFRLIHPH